MNTTLITCKYKKRFYLSFFFIFYFLLLIETDVFSQEYSWSGSAGSVGEDYGLDIASDPNGNIYTTGYFSGIIDINTGSASTILSSNGSKDAFITKHTEDGLFLWARKIGGQNIDIGNALVVNDSGFVYVLGTFQGNVDFDPGPSVFNLNSSSSGSFILKLNSNGNFVWAVNLLSSNPHSIDIGKSGEVYFTSATDFGKVSAGGTVVWKKPSLASLGYSGSLHCSQYSNSIYLVDGNYPGKICKLDSSGNIIWNKNSAIYSKAIVADSSDNIYVTGFFGGTVDFDPGAATFNLTSLGNKDVFVFKLDSSGNFKWACNFGSSTNFFDEGNSISICPMGDIFVTGTYGAGNNDFDPGPGVVSLPSGGGTEIFILKLDSTGNLIWASSSAGSADDDPKAITYSNNSVFLTGYFTSSNLFFDLVNFSDNLVSNGGNGDIFFAKIKDCLSTYSTLNITECGFYVSPSGQYTYTSSGIYTDTIPNTTGCDSIITLNVTIQPVYTIFNPQTICSGSSYFINGNSYNLPGTFIDSLQTISGCDSVIITQLNVVQSITISTSITKPSCGSDNGEISATISSGNESYFAFWSNGDQGNTADSLVAGQYVLQVNTPSGCFNSLLVNLNSVTGPTVTQANISNVLCYGQQTGSINLSLASVNPLQLIQWSNGFLGTTITNLSAGVYDVNITDSVGCSTFYSYTITQPNPLGLSISSTPASCAGSNGTATVTAFGGSGNYSYQWSATAGSQFSPTAGNLFPGIYTCYVTDNNGCLFSNSVAVTTNPPGPVITAIATPSYGCRPAQLGSIDLTVSGGISPYSFQWNTGQITEDITGLSPGSYTAVVSSSDGCATTINITVPNALIQQNPEICLVSVDTSTNTNRIYWEKPAQANGINYFTLFRETSILGVFFPIKTIPFDSLSEWTDSFANPQTRGWRYKISSTDSCGSETSKSPVHKTIHLAANNGVGGVVNLAWDNYIGFSYSKFYIWRLDFTNAWQLLDSLPSNLFSYTDLNPPTAGNLSYFIEVISPQICQTSARISGEPNQSMGTVVKTRSNVKNNRTVGFLEQPKSDFKIFPNPTQNKLYLQTSLSNEYTYSLLNIFGETIEDGKFTKEKEFNFSELGSGVYYLMLKERNNLYLEKVVISK